MPGCLRQRDLSSKSILYSFCLCLLIGLAQSLNLDDVRYINENETDLNFQIQSEHIADRLKRELFVDMEGSGPTTGEISCFHSVVGRKEESL